jgi:hypothetical protein
MDESKRVEELQCGRRPRDLGPVDTSCGAMAPAAEGGTKSLAPGGQNPLDLIYEGAGFRNRIAPFFEVAIQDVVQHALYPSAVKALRTFLVLGLVLAIGSACEDAAPPEELPNSVEGVVIEVESEGLGEVTSFMVKDGDETYEIGIDPDRDYGFDLGHLSEHRSTGDPVFVDLETREGELIAVTIEDA